MKPTLQLGLGQHLTMTPQLQQAIRLLQLSTLDLKQEIQEALDSNLMLETEEEAKLREQEFSDTSQTDINGSKLSESSSANDASETDSGGNDNIPDELPVDTAWEDLYDIPAVPVNNRSSDDQGDYLQQQSHDASLHDYLYWQMNLTPFSETDLSIAIAIIDAVNDDGYLSQSVEEIRLSVLGENEQPDSGDTPTELFIEEVEAVLHRIQRFDPPGIAARNPRECLLIQLQQLPTDLAMREQALRLIEDHFELLANRDTAQIQRHLQLDEQEMQAMVALIRSLNPRPGDSVVTSRTEYVEPDVFVFKRNGRWTVELNPDATPRLRVNGEYASLVQRANNSSDNVTLKNHLQEARWFIKSLHSRNETVLRVATKIVELQQNFLEYGDEAMKPMILHDIAEALDMHESTISRVTTQKYMHTPNGTLEFKYFFSSHVSTMNGGEASATAIRALLRKLIDAEKPQKPLSDNKLAALIGEQGINIARRTIAKYRESMAIPPSNERKRLS